MFSKRTPVMPFFLFAGALGVAAAQAAVPPAPRKQTNRLGVCLHAPDVKYAFPGAGVWSELLTFAFDNGPSRKLKTPPDQFR